MTTKEALQTILNDEAQYKTSLNYAIAYTQEASLVQERLRVQCLYVLSSITHWIHPQAAEVRMALRREAGLK